MSPIIRRFDIDEDIVGLARARLHHAYDGRNKQDFKMEVGNPNVVRDLGGLLVEPIKVRDSTDSNSKTEVKEYCTGGSSI